MFMSDVCEDVDPANIEAIAPIYDGIVVEFLEWSLDSTMRSFRQQQAWKDIWDITVEDVVWPNKAR